MGPGAVVDVAERRVLQSGANDVAIGVVDPLAHPRIGGDQVHAVDVKGLLIFVKEILMKQAVDHQVLDILVIGVLIPSCEAVSYNYQVGLGSWRAGGDELGHTIGHA